MGAKAGAVLVLVCPQCGKKYKGDANKPDARYQCPADQSTLIRLDSDALDAMQPPKASAESRPQVRTEAYMDTRPIAPPPVPERLGYHDHGAYASPQTSLDGTPFSNDFNFDVSQPPSPAEGFTTPNVVSPVPDVLISKDFGPAIQTDQPEAAERTILIAGLPDDAITQEGNINGLLTGFEHRRSVVATLERLGGIDAKTGERVPVYKYETKNKLGAGGMGEVHKVLDRDLRREVALKMLKPHPGSAVGEEEMLRFIKEAQATGRLEHPNIVPVHDLGVDAEGRIYFTLKYVKGVSLKEVIRGRRDNTQLEDKRKFRDVFSARQMIEILVSICNAVAYAHSKDIIHRDLKPDNIMLGKFGEVLLMDWGLAKVLSQRMKGSEEQDAFLDLGMRAGMDMSMTMEGAIAGTPAYMSPEQAAGKISELDERTDVYSLGAMLYEILSGDPPYKGTTALEVVRMVTAGPPEPLSNGIHGFKPIPRELKAICEKAMTHDVKRRYPSAEAMRDDLQAYLSDAPVSCCPDTLVKRSVKFFKRNRQQVTSAFTNVIIVLAFVLICWFGYREFKVQQLLNQAQAEVTEGKVEYDQYRAIGLKVREGDPYKADLRSAAQEEIANRYREQLNLGIDAARQALDIAPSRGRARRFLAENYMELWRLATTQNNADLMSAYSAEVLRYAPNPENYRRELEGFGNMDVVVDPPDADVYLFRFEPMHATDKQGNMLPARLIPVPYDIATQQSDENFLAAERQRAHKKDALPDSAISIFRLDPTPASRLGSGKISVNGLPPGSYMLLLLAVNHVEMRVPFTMEREGSVVRYYKMPGREDIPSGFVYVAGGNAWIGGDTSNALPRQKQKVVPFLIQQQEVTMGDYAQFLKAIGKSANNRLPRDSSKPFAALTTSGLAPVDGSDSAMFAESPARGISYNDAIAYLSWRSLKDNIAYRLPTDLEWESACRGADDRKYSWGNTPGQGLAAENQSAASPASNDNWSWQDYKDESPWGVHNLAGGVAEWTGSPFEEKTPMNSAIVKRAVRGNALSLLPTGLECSFRTGSQPDFAKPTIGFRLAADWPVKSLGLPKPDDITSEDVAAAPIAPDKPPAKPKAKPEDKVQQALHKLGLDK